MNVWFVNGVKVVDDELVVADMPADLQPYAGWNVREVRVYKTPPAEVEGVLSEPFEQARWQQVLTLDTLAAVWQAADDQQDAAVHVKLAPEHKPVPGAFTLSFDFQYFSFITDTAEDLEYEQEIITFGGQDPDKLPGALGIYISKDRKIGFGIPPSQSDKKASCSLYVCVGVNQKIEHSMRLVSGEQYRIDFYYNASDYDSVDGIAQGTGTISVDTIGRESKQWLNLGFADELATSNGFIHELFIENGGSDVTLKKK